MAETLSKQPRPKGPRLTIVTNAGGPAVLATDALIANGGELATLSEESLRSLDQFLPRHWSHNNPIDLLGDADSERYAKALDIAVSYTHLDVYKRQSVARTAGPPALVTIVSRGPLGRGCLLRVSAM